MRALLLVVLLPSVASAEAILLRTTWEAWNPNQSNMQMRGVALLDYGDPTVVTGGWLNFHNSGYQMRVDSGQWDPTRRMVDLEGVGCVFTPHPDVCGGPDIPMTYTNHAPGVKFRVEGQLIAGPAPGSTIRQHPIGDANMDLVFDSDDLIAVFGQGEYEDNILCRENELGFVECEINEVGYRNSGWASGDWNVDREFDSSDLILAFQDGGYGRAAAFVPEPSALVLLLIGVAVVLARR